MPPSIVEKYELILAADPRSRIFVELAKALVERGDLSRAIEVCRRGLEHHPSSILGRVTWGRALLESGDAKGALEHFEIAIAIEPASPYAYNHVGEALLAKGRFREALPVLARAVELQPADARVRGWLEAAREGAKTQPEPPAPSPQPSAPASGGKGDAAKGPPASAEGAARAPAAAPPPPLPPPLPPGASRARAKAKDAPRSVLQLIPDDEPARARGGTGSSLASRLGVPAVHATATLPAPHADPAEAERAAAEYERQVRAKLLAAGAPPPSFLHRHRRLVLGGAVALALGASTAVYLVVSARNAAIRAAGAAGRARAGIARDTLAALREARRLLEEARDHSKDPEIDALAAQVAAILAADHGDEKARDAARALVKSGKAGEGAVAAAWLLARTPAERAAAEDDVLAARPSASPLLHALAGGILLRRGEVDAGRGRLEIAARSNPPLLRALADLGDAALAGGDPEAALAYYGAALGAHATHPRSAVGAAEARLALEKDLAVSRRELEAVDADAGSAPPVDLRLRFEIVRARVGAALGEPGPAATRLARAAEKLGETPTLAATVAELHLQAREWEKAEAAAARAAAREPRSAEHRVLLARARIGRGRFVQAIAATDGMDGRAVRIQRAIARYQLGQWGEARAELGRTARDGKVPADAAVWYALVDVASGRAERALPLLEKLAEAKPPPPLAHVALGRALEALGRRSDAEEAYRKGAEREPLAPEPHFALGRLLLASGRARDAVAPLERAVRIDPSDVDARRALGEARLAAGQPSAARADLDFVLLAAPKDPGALRLVSAAWLAEGHPREARRAADRAVGVSPRDPGALLAAARAAQASGDEPAARKLAERAVRAGAQGPDRDEAKRIAAAQLPRRK